MCVFICPNNRVPKQFNGHILFFLYGEGKFFFVTWVAGHVYVEVVAESTKTFVCLSSVMMASFASWRASWFLKWTRKLKKEVSDSCSIRVGLSDKQNGSSCSITFGNCCWVKNRRVRTICE